MELCICVSVCVFLYIYVLPIRNSFKAVVPNMSLSVSLNPLMLEEGPLYSLLAMVDKAAKRSHPLLLG